MKKNQLAYLLATVLMIGTFAGAYFLLNLGKQPQAKGNSDIAVIDPNSPVEVGKVDLDTKNDATKTTTNEGNELVAPSTGNSKRIELNNGFHPIANVSLRQVKLWDRVVVKGNKQETQGTTVYGVALSPKGDEALVYDLQNVDYFTGKSNHFTQRTPHEKNDLVYLAQDASRFYVVDQQTAQIKTFAAPGSIIGQYKATRKDVSFSQGHINPKTNDLTLWYRINETWHLGRIDGKTGAFYIETTNIKDKLGYGITDAFPIHRTNDFLVTYKQDINSKIQSGTFRVLQDGSYRVAFPEMKMKQPKQLEMTPDGNYAVVRSGDSMEFFEFDTKKRTYEWDVKYYYPRMVRIIPGKYKAIVLAASNYDVTTTTSKFSYSTAMPDLLMQYDLKTGKRDWTYQPQESKLSWQSFGLSDDGTKIVTANPKHVAVFQLPK